MITSQQGTRLDAVHIYKLESLGLVNSDGYLCTPSCELYRLYFSSQLFQEDDSAVRRLQQLEEENQTLHFLVPVDSLTQVGNRRYFDRYLEEEWKNLAIAQQPLRSPKSLNPIETPLAKSLLGRYYN